MQKVMDEDNESILNKEKKRKRVFWILRVGGVCFTKRKREGGYFW